MRDGADREKFEAWLHREQVRVNREVNDRLDECSGILLPTCLGGPVDGMLAAVAESIGRTEARSLYLPALLVLTSPLEGPVALEHRYARDHRGGYAYVGLARVRT